ncbi:hypothetical protein BDV06DRAFT_205019 [Aspergillus oleicola]
MIPTLPSDCLLLASYYPPSDAADCENGNFKNAIAPSTYSTFRVNRFFIFLKVTHLEGRPSGSLRVGTCIARYSLRE